MAADSDIVRFKRGSTAQVGRYFQAREFDCRCGSCEYTFVSTTLVKALDTIRRHLSARVIIDSGYRCPYQQAQLKAQGLNTAKGRSQHEDGRAADIRSDSRSGKDLAKFAEMSGILAIGVGPDWVHVDTRVGKRRRWAY